MYFTPLGRQPFFEAVTAWVGIEVAELDEISNAICLKLCELSLFSFPVSCENRCRLMRVWRVLIPWGTRPYLQAFTACVVNQYTGPDEVLGADLGFYLALLLFL